MQQVINEAGIKLIKDFEGCKCLAYKCPAGVWTIGYGHTGEDVYIGLRISEEEAEELLKDDIYHFEHGVAQLLKVTVNDNQFSALVAFAYNVGLANLKNSTLLRCVNKGNAAQAPGEFLRWNHAAGKVLSGLTKRRQAESDLFQA